MALNAVQLHVLTIFEDVGMCDIQVSFRLDIINIIGKALRTDELHGWLLRFSVLGFGKGQIRQWLGGRLRLISCNSVTTFQLEISIANMGKLVFHTPASGCTWCMQCLKMRCRLSHLQLLRHRFIQSIKAWKAEWRRGFGGTIQHTYRSIQYAPVVVL